MSPRFPSAMTISPFARQYCTVSGGLASPYCPSTATGYYSRNTSMPICPVHGGGTLTRSFTALLDDKASFETSPPTTASTTGEQPSATEKTEKTVPEASDGKGSQKAASRENPSASSADTQLRKENEQLRRENTELREENERLQSRVDHLRGFLGGIASSCAEEARQ